jgi:hypothetical protein
MLIVVFGTLVLYGAVRATTERLRRRRVRMTL